VTGTLVEPAAPPEAGGVHAPARRSRVAALVAVAGLAVLVVSAVHLTQGTSSVGPFDLLRLAAGDGEDRTAAVFVASRLPRLLAGLLVGFALGVAGAALQSVARNPLASPDTLGVNAGAYLAVVSVNALGIALPVLSSGAVAFAGGLLAAGLVLVLSAAGASGPTRLVLAGSAVALALGALTTLLLILFQESTVGLFAWGSGSLVQSDLHAVTRMAPVVALAVLGLMLLGRRLDLLALGDDTAAVLGVAVRRTRVAAVLLAVLLSAAAVTVAGPVGFVGLVAPVLVRLLGAVVREVHRHRVLLPLSGVVGGLVVVTADVMLRLVLGGQGGVDVPTGVVTTLIGAAVLVWLARRFRDSGPTRQAPGLSGRRLPGRGFTVGVTTAALLAVVAAFVVGMLAGDRWVLTGDLVNWAQGTTGRAMTYVLDTRLPRVLAALLAGAALGLAGTVVQAVCRNPLAEPGIIGITGGAGVGAVLVITAVPAAGIWAVTGAAGVGAFLAFAAVYLLSWRPGDRRGTGLASDRLVLIGVGVSAGAGAVTTFVILVTDPWNSALALTWLSGSTYGRTLEQVVPVAVTLAVVAPLALSLRDQLDLLALDDDTPRVLGVRLERTRLWALASAALLTATAVSAIGVVGFVGLVAPHVARTLVGARHHRVLPVATLLGAVLVSAADTIGRSVIAPAQVPAGLLTALLGAPYFVWLLWRSRDLAGTAR
jgi:iron complex transport system permease protein